MDELDDDVVEVSSGERFFVNFRISSSPTELDLMVYSWENLDEAS